MSKRTFIDLTGEISGATEEPTSKRARLTHPPSVLVDLVFISNVAAKAAAAATFAAAIAIKTANDAQGAVHAAVVLKADAEAKFKRAMEEFTSAKAKAARRRRRESAAKIRDARTMFAKMYAERVKAEMKAEVKAEAAAANAAAAAVAAAAAAAAAGAAAAAATAAAEAKAAKAAAFVKRMKAGKARKAAKNAAAAAANAAAVAMSAANKAIARANNLKAMVTPEPTRRRASGPVCGEKKATEMVNAAMSKHGLIKNGWTFKFNNRKRTLGVTKHGRTKSIELSRDMVNNMPADVVNNTILHEVAHALVGPRHGHDSVWKAMAIKIGCNGSRLGPRFKVSYKHQYKCSTPGCTAKWNFHALTQKRKDILAGHNCSKCRKMNSFRRVK